MFQGSTAAGLKCGVASLALVAAMPVFAQDGAPAPQANGQAVTQSAPQAPAAQSDQSSPDIVVTGTLFRNAAAATASPVISLTSTDLADKGINTVADALQMIAANNGGTMPGSWSTSGFAKGASAPSLRGLTDGRTLTLFDGLRSAAYPLADDGDRNFVDLNIIPESIVDRIDVLQDGASSTYGADAVAGVVNVIIKKEITGVHLNGSAGISQRGDAGEQRIDGTIGYGKLSEQGWNAYVNAEFQNDNPLYLNDRGAPYNTADHSGMCAPSTVHPGTTTCRANEVLNGVQANGSFPGQVSTPVGFVAPYLADGSGPVPGAQYQLLNPSAGCGSFPSYTLTAAQRAADSAFVAGHPGSVGAAPSVCQDDLRNRYTQYSSKIQRVGANAHLTVNVGSQAKAYAMFNFYQSRTYNPFRDGPVDFEYHTAAGGVVEYLTPILLPVYVCPRGTAGTCTAANGKLNPNNPFAAAGEQARLLSRYDRTMEDDTVANSYRYSAGIAGSFGNAWNYSFDASHSDVYLKYTSENYINARHLLNVIADGSYNFVNPDANSQAERDYLSPTVVVNSESRLTLIQGSLSHSFFTLPGGDLQVAVGAAYRKESITNPSGNPPNDIDPYDRFYRLNSVSVIGRRTVKSAYFEIDAPIFKAIDLKGSGRYDNYSTGQSNFSPKIEAQFTPIEQIKLRGTYSKGFRIASFNEAFGAPTTGYNPAVAANAAGSAAFVAAHGGDAYATQSYLYGLTSVGNPTVKPEKSTSYTFGVVLKPLHWLTLTADYYDIKVKDLIATPSCAGPVISQYYANNGVTNVPGCVSAPDSVDPNAPNALPRLGFITSAYTNSGSLTSRGLDFTANARIPLGSGIHLTSNLSATLLSYLALTDNTGKLFRYDGTLGPCEVTSCSGSPKFRGNWTNTLDFNGRGSLSATVNYTSGYTLDAADDGGVYGNCAASIGADVVTYDDGTPVSCHTKRFIDLDMTASIKVRDRFTLYMNVLNILDVKAPFDPSAVYSFNQFNPAWASAGFIGRYIRVGAKVDF